MATLSGIEVEADPTRAATLPTLAVDDDAVTMSLGLPDTGVEGVLAGAAAALLALLLGIGVLLLVGRRRRAG
ncbi:LPXTG cell wall anchor domain-containing protein [Schumannella luteola]|nr:LPXTG cell wall anchor domain-containing protein [Schumannella luteola]